MRFLTLLVCLLPLGFVKPALLNLLGHKISSKAKIGWSLIVASKMDIDDECRIGHFNFVGVSLLKMKRHSSLGRLNFIKGSFLVFLDERSSIGNYCVISRANKGVSYGTSKLSLGVLTKLTSGHKVDMMRDVIFGDYSILAGSSSQLWTHGYLHAPKGPDRFRIDGDIRIGNNVYIGSSCVINAGVFVADGITIGSNSCVSKNLIKPGMYVAQPLRYIEKDYEETKSRLRRIDWDGLVEEVYEKPSS